MQITFAATPTADAAVLVRLVEKDGLARAGLAASAQPVAAAAAKAQRFEGEAGSVIELFVPDDGAVRHLLLLGVGGGGEAD